MNKKTVPVLMFHSVGSDIHNWSRYFLSVNITHFEKFCEYLKEKSYRTLFLNEWYDIQNNGFNSKDRLVVLTFDDGYLDNYVYAYPILKKYGLKGTVFVNPEFVDDKNTTPRPRYDQAGFNKNDIKNILGFLNWAEIAEMESSGVIDIQNHTMTHNKYFSGPQLKGFFSKDNAHKYDWLLWNMKPELKPHYMHISLFDHVDVGYPVFEHERALVIRRFFPDEILVNLILDRYKHINDKKSLSNNEVDFKMIAEYEKLRHSGNYLGRYETDEEMYLRYEYELKESKKIFRAKLNKTTDFLCWPGGGNNEITIKLSKSLGYKASTFNSRENGKEFDNKEPYKRIPRIGMGSFINFKEKVFFNRSKSHLTASFLAQRGNFYHRFILKSKKLFFFLTH